MNFMTNSLLVLTLFFVGCQKPEGLNHANFIPTPEDYTMQIVTDDSFGSGTLMRVNSMSVVVTAGHVCDGTTSISVRNKSGDFIASNWEYIFDSKSDVCVIKVPELLSGLGLTFGNKVDHGDEVEVFAFPLGLYSEDFVYHGEGTYLGEVDGSDVYNLACAPGCSGTPYIDMSGQVVGMLTRGHQQFSWLTLSHPLADIKQEVYNLLKLLK